MKKFMVLLLTGFLLFQSSSFAWAQDVKKMDNVTDPMLKAQFWVNQINSPNEIIMSLAEIANLNQEIAEKSDTYVYNLSTLPDSYSKSQLNKMVDQKIPETDYYVDGKPLTQEYWDKLKENLNLKGIAENNQVRYGFTVRRTNLKIFPTADIISDDSNDLAYDEFQNSGILINEPVLVLHQSADSQWLYIMMQNCSGWALVNDIALCPDKDTWLKNQNYSDFMVVTGNKIKLEPDPYAPEMSELELAMGSILEFVNSSELPQSINERALYDNYVVKIPTRGSTGDLIYKLALIPVSRDISCGFLPYTRANILKQAFKMHGDRYGWGGMLNSRDCSQLVVEVYRCFGINLPRNTESQVKVPCKTASFGSLDIENRNNLLDNLAPGSLLLFPGHVMIYLGMYQGKYYVISDLGSFAQFDANSSKANVIRTRSVVVNELGIKRANGKSWIECLTIGKQIEKSKFEDIDKYEEKEAIENLADKFILSGNGNHLLRPAAPLTRAEFSVMLCRALSLNGDKNYAREKFSDLKDNWSEGFIGAVAKEELMLGTAPNQFAPGSYINKDEITVIMGRALKKKGIICDSEGGEKILNDIVSVQGVSEQTTCLNRYQAAVVLYNYLQVPDAIIKGS
ncbi:MAG: SH3 domain-containing protein [Syntrophomonas sp.]